LDVTASCSTLIDSVYSVYYNFLPDDLSLLQMILMSIMQKWWLELQGLSAVFDLGIFMHNGVSTEELQLYPQSVLLKTL
jgi:hypothetical protein